MRKTKIVCTIGPASSDIKIMSDMIDSGMNVARLNFSHGTYENHLKNINTLKQLRTEKGVSLAIMLDTKGPEIRLKNFKNGCAEVESGKSFLLTSRDIEGDENGASYSFPCLADSLSPGNTILIDDGNLEMRVESINGGEITCTVIQGGVIKNHKSINIPHIHINIPYLCDQDKNDILFGIKNDVDFIAASFVRSKDDVIALRKFINYNGGHDIKIISKIENLEGVMNFDEILDYSEGIMVARGDMGVEIEYERLPGLQKKFIKKCYQSGKMVITATQMLESMINNYRPTRAEITDVANAVFDGTSAVMLSGETAAGKFPVNAVRVMSKIAEQAEFDAFEAGIYDNISYDMDTSDTTNAICDAACTLAKDIKAQAIIALTKYGQTARRMSKFRPRETIIAATPVEKTFHQLALSWGVFPVLARYQHTADELFLHAIDCAKLIDAVASGDHVVIAAGIPLDTPGSTNTLKVEIVK